MKIEGIGSVVNRVLDKMYAGYTIQPAPPVPWSVYRYLDALKEHFPPDGLIQIGGSDSEALLKSLIFEMCVQSKYPSVTLMNSSQAELMVVWLLSSLSSIPIGEILDNRVQPADFEAFNEAVTAIVDVPMIFCIGSILTLYKEIPGLMHECGAKIIFVDADTPSLNDEERKDAFGSLKSMASRDHVQVIARVPTDGLLAIASEGDVGVLVQNQEDGGRLEVIDRTTGKRESVFCFIQELEAERSHYSPP